MFALYCLPGTVNSNPVKIFTPHWTFGVGPKEGMQLLNAVPSKTNLLDFSLVY